MPKKTNTTPPAAKLVRPAAARKPRAIRKSAAATSDKDDLNVGLDRTEIASRAYELFLAEGGTHGRDIEHWLQAERELRARGLTSAA
jgi:hypothetical protein